MTTVKTAALAGAMLLALSAGGCSQLTSGAATVNAFTTQIQNACNEAMPLVPLAGPIAPYIMAACTVDGVAKLATDPSSVQWLGSLIGQVKALAPAQLAAGPALPKL